MKQEKNAVITRTEVIGIQELLSSPDKENETVALTILEQCNYIKSLPWLIILYREMNIELQKELKDKTKKLHKFLTTYFPVGDPLSVQNAHVQLIKVANSEDAVKYMVEERFAIKMKKQLEDWGFGFMNNYSLVIKLKDDNTGQE